MMYIDAIEYVRENLSKEEQLAQLAEECAELGKAALKLRRVYDGRNPTPVTRPEAFNNLIEEIADVSLCMEVLGMNTAEVLYNCAKMRLEKAARWKRRLEECGSNGNRNQSVSESAEKVGLADSE